jgi:hypothetical protein
MLHRKSAGLANHFRLHRTLTFSSFLSRCSLAKAVAMSDHGDLSAASQMHWPGSATNTIPTQPSGPLGVQDDENLRF